LTRPDVAGLRALFVNCTLKPSPELSNTAGLMAVSAAIMGANGVHVDKVRAVDHHLAPGVQPDMTAHGAARDDWSPLYERVRAADILVLGTPIWLGDKSSVCTRVSSGSTPTPASSTTAGSTPTTARSAAWS
jgi:multimeric flavodoxin WrbA